MPPPRPRFPEKTKKSTGGPGQWPREGSELLIGGGSNKLVVGTSHRQLVRTYQAPYWGVIFHIRSFNVQQLAESGLSGGVPYYSSTRALLLVVRAGGWFD